MASVGAKYQAKSMNSPMAGCQKATLRTELTLPLPREVRNGLIAAWRRRGAGSAATSKAYWQAIKHSNDCANVMPKPNIMHEAAQLPLEPLTVRIPVAVQLTGIGRSKLYELIAAGEVDAVKIGASTLITVASLRRLIQKSRR